MDHDEPDCPAHPDVLIIGGGPAGLTAALYLARYHLRTLVIDAGHSRAAFIPRTHNLAGHPEGIAGPALLARMQQVILAAPVPRLRRIAVPTLLLWGEQDRMIPVRNADDYRAAMPQARLVTLAGLGHLPFEEAPEVALAPLRAFLRETAAGPPPIVRLDSAGRAPQARE